MHSRLWTVILAAGASRRMGRPKALLPLGKKTFLTAIAGRYRRLGLPVAVVVGSELGQRLPAELSWTRSVVNPRVEDGPLSSLRRGLEVLPPDAPAVIVHPVDHPLVRPATLRSLLEMHLRHPEAILVPEFRGEPGHPTLFPRTVFAELREAPLESGARWVVERKPERVVRVPVQDPGVLRNIDTWELYRRWVPGTCSGAGPDAAAGDEPPDPCRHD